MSRYTSYLLLKNKALTPKTLRNTDLSGSLNSFNTVAVEHKHISSFFSLQDKAIRDFEGISEHM